MSFQSFGVDSATFIQLSDLGPSYGSNNRSTRNPDFMTYQNTDLILNDMDGRSSLSSESSTPSSSQIFTTNQQSYHQPSLPQDPVLLNPNLYLYAPNNRQKLKNLLAQIPLAIPQWLWEEDDQTDDCFECRRDFNLFNRRHHCRRCGIIFCDSCSSTKALLSESFNEGSEEHLTQQFNSSSAVAPRRCVWTKRVDLTLSRVCHACSGILQDNETVSKFLAMRNSCGVFLELNSEGLTISTFDDLSLQKIDEKSSEVMLDCPACHRKLDTFGTSDEQEAHVARCLKKGPTTSTSPPDSPLSFILPDGGEAQYVPYNLSEKDPIVDQECQICLDIFRVGDEAARLSCFCCFHLLCAQDWFQRCPTCPTHGL